MLAYDAYCEELLGASKNTIPRGFNDNYNLGCDEECIHHFYYHQQANSTEEVDVMALALLQKVDVTCKARWTEVLESIIFIHSSRKAWQTINQFDS